MAEHREFLNLYNQDLLRVAVGVPSVRVADPQHNARHTIALLERAAAERATIALFPELGLSSYTADDLFHQRALLDGSLDALASVVEASKELPTLCVVGLPLQVEHLLFNCAAVVHRGKVLAVVPKTYLPNYREFYEARQFASADIATVSSVRVVGHEAPFGPRLLLRDAQDPRLTLFVEICEDLWVPIPPSSFAALAGATVLLNLSASNVIVAKAGYRRELVAGQSARCLAAYLYSAAGPGESTTDLAWDGHALIAENGDILVESERFAPDPQLIIAEIDLERLSQDRMRQTTFGQSVLAHRAAVQDFQTVPITVERFPQGELLPNRTYPRFPYVPADPATRGARCAEVFRIQVQGLTRRLEFTGVQHPVIGVSGGLDSAHALLVCAQAMDRLGLPRSNILAYTMPGFATSTRTLEQAHTLMEAIGAESNEIDIRPSCRQMLADIGHPFAQGEPVYDVTFENVQAGERTSHLFRIANARGGMVVGTGDLSELALGWCTYGVGDQMSHYAVNASVPKTLIQHVIRWVAETDQLGAATSGALRRILTTEISPELVPGTSDGSPPQGSEAVLGPYELHDFFLYYTLRFGFAPTKVAFLAYCAWHDRCLGSWPDIPEESRHQYDLAAIKRNLATFLDRFFRQSQFKRSAIPNAPKVGSGGSLSPRGDYRAPSDAESVAWLRQLDRIPD
jgi:NAD+ synthase (glutamine-hydrolysing)